MHGVDCLVSQASIPVECEQNNKRYVYMYKALRRTNYGPTTDYPDPCDAKSGELKKARHLPSRQHSNLFMENAACRNVPSLSNINEDIDTGPTESDTHQCEIACQTSEQLFSSMDMLSMVAQIHQLKQEKWELHETYAVK